MTNPFEFPEMVSLFLSADWSKHAEKRSVYLANVRGKSIKRCYHPDHPGDKWSLKALLRKASELARSCDGAVLIGIDVVLGVSGGFWQQILEQKCQCPPGSFVDWLGSVGDSPDFFEEVKNPDDWSVNQPWFKVPKRKDGGLTVFENRVGGMLRQIERKTGAKPMFAVSGIPGTVGSATREVWKELFPLLPNPNRDFAIWPFEGELETLVKEQRIVLCEIYPALAYAVALADKLPTNQIKNARKTKEDWRNYKCCCLEQAGWVLKYGVQLGDLDPLRKSDDDFDAHFTAAAVLRCILEERKLADDEWIDSKAEGSMLLAGPVKPDRTSKGP